MGAGGLQIGRDAERDQLASVLRDAASGQPGAVLVSGEPGIGKTSLVADVTSGPAAEGHLVLWGRCLHFGADSSPYLPFTQALTQWHRHADAAERRRVLTGAEHLGSIAPSLGTSGDEADTTRVVPLVAAVLDRIAERSPLVLVVDDLQWADGSSLDLLAYLVAGLDTGERLSMLLTFRDPELLAVGHRLHGWLADVRRLPAVSRLHLERLGRAETEALVVDLRGGSAGSSDLAEEIYRKSDGNPYYTELLVRGHDDGPSSARDGLPATLLSSWHRLPSAAREVLQLLAVGGRPVDVGVLEGLSAAHGWTPEQVASSLAESTGAGLTTTTPNGAVWFHHPLLAEVIAGTLTPAGRQVVHRHYVEVVEASTDLAPASRAAHLALHHAGAGDSDQAFVWSLRAADEAAAIRGYNEEFDHLQRACDLWPDVSEGARGATGQRIDLWQRASDCAWSAGEHLAAIRLREHAVGFAEDAQDHPRAVRLRLRLPWWRFVCSDGEQVSVEDTRTTLELAKLHCRETPEHVQALARLVHAEAWNQDPSAPFHAAAAVRMARRIGSPEALAWALCALTMMAPPEESLAHAAEARALARDTGDPELMGWAARESSNRLDALGRAPEASQVLLTTFRLLVATGSVHDAMYANPARVALILVEFGRWEEAREVLREILSHRPFADVGAATRGVAALLAFRVGDSIAGRTHLSRAKELQPQASPVGFSLTMIDLEAQVYLGQHEEALSLATWMMPDNVAVDPPGADEVLVLAARGAGDLAEQPGRRDHAVALLNHVEELRGYDSRFVRSSAADVIHPARSALFAADRARCHGEADTAELWREAVAACRAAGLVWHEALASYQLARALLAEHHPRSEATSALRHAAQTAADLGAAPILSDCEELARQVHVSLDEPALTVVDSGDGDVFSSLTTREREVLSHIVAGRTYAETAEALFISEKTVSVHVSNLLRKTGTRSRVEVADLVRRSTAS